MKKFDSIISIYNNQHVAYFRSLLEQFRIGSNKSKIRGEMIDRDEFINFINSRAQVIIRKIIRLKNKNRTIECQP